MFQPGEAENQIPRGNSYDCNIGGGCEEMMRAKLPNSIPYGDDGGFRGRDGTNKRLAGGGGGGGLELCGGGGKVKVFNSLMPQRL